MWYKIRTYIQFLWQSSNRHAVHSPFVYNFYTTCLLSYKKFSKASTIQEIRNKVFSDKSIIEVNDFGRGSRIFKSKFRSVAKIGKIAGITKKKSLLLASISTYFKPNAILELGTSVGLASTVFSIAQPNAAISTLEGCQNTAGVAQKTFDQFNLTNIKVITGPFSKTLAPVLDVNQFDLTYFDGNHSKDSTLDYFYLCLRGVHKDSVFIFDDIYWSPEMHMAWQEIIQNPKTTVSINTYFWGIVFFNQDFTKQDFILRC